MVSVHFTPPTREAGQRFHQRSSRRRSLDLTDFLARSQAPLRRRLLTRQYTHAADEEERKEVNDHAEATSAGPDDSHRSRDPGRRRRSDRASSQQRIVHDDQQVLGHLDEPEPRPEPVEPVVQELPQQVTDLHASGRDSGRKRRGSRPRALPSRLDYSSPLRYQPRRWGRSLIVRRGDYLLPEGRVNS